MRMTELLTLRILRTVEMKHGMTLVGILNILNLLRVQVDFHTPINQDPYSSSSPLMEAILRIITQCQE